MKHLIILLILFLSTSVNADQFICSYPKIGKGDPVITKIDVNEGSDTVMIDSKITEYRVLENNEFGLIVVKSFSNEGLTPEKSDIVIHVIIIDKQGMKITVSGVVSGIKLNYTRTGTCIR